MKHCWLLVMMLTASVHAAQVQVLLFARVGQSQSDDAMAQIAVVTSKSAAATNVQVILSGPSAAADATKLVLPKSLPAKVLTDPEYALAGKHNVHVWPATVILGGDGKEVARIAGLRPSYATDLDAYLDLAAGKIDKATLDQRLASKQIVTPTSQQAATRHVLIANALIDRGQIEQALKEVDDGLKRQPDEISLRVTRAKLLLQLKQPAAALAAAEELADRVPPWQANALRAEALIALERWSEAKIAAEEAVKLNPNPADANYLRGLIFWHEGDWQRAAEAFRRAYEASHPARRS